MRQGERRYFNPRPPRGGRPKRIQEAEDELLFQSTSSARRTTMATISAISTSSNFNPRPPRGGRRGASSYGTKASAISIHVLREEDDWTSGGGPTPTWYFNPRPPRGGRLPLIYRFRYIPHISIHVLREEDDFRLPSAVLMGSISIHVLREEDDREADYPCRGCGISIHVLREEDDLRLRYSPQEKRYFNPRPPRGGRQAGKARRAARAEFQSTSSARRTTRL